MFILNKIVHKKDEIWINLGQFSPFPKERNLGSDRATPMGEQIDTYTKRVKDGQRDIKH